MARSIIGVIVGYVTMTVLVIALFTGLYMVLGQERSFKPGVYEPSALWVISSTVLGIIAAVGGGVVCALITRSRKAGLWLAGVVVVLGLLFAVLALADASEPAQARLGDVSNMEAMQKARQPVWVMVMNPIIGAAGVVIGTSLVLRKPA